MKNQSGTIKTNLELDRMVMGVQVVTGDSQEEVLIFRDTQTHMHHNIYIIFIIFILIFNFTFFIFFFLGRAESRDTLQETGSPSVTRSCSPSTMSLSWKLAWGRRRGSTAWTMGKGCSSALAGPSAEQKPASARKRIEPAIQDATRTSAVTTISSECVSSVITPSSECVSSQ